MREKASMGTRQGRSLHVVQHLRPESRGAADEPGLEDVLASLYAAGRQAWPKVPRAEENFLRHLAERLPPGDVARGRAAVHACGQPGRRRVARASNQLSSLRLGEVREVTLPQLQRLAVGNPGKEELIAYA